MNKKLVLLMVSALFGCTLGPDYKRPDTVADDQIAASLEIEQNDDTTLDREWYKSFGDDRLNALIELAQADSPDVAAAVHKMRQARLMLDINGVQYFPTVDLSGAYTKLKPSKNTSSAFKENYYQAGLDVSWELDIWGAGRRQTESDIAAFEATAANLENVRISLKSEVINAYVSLRSAQEQLRLLTKNLRLQQRIVSLSADKTAAGLISTAQMRQMQYAADIIRSQIPDLKTAVATYKNMLTLLAGKLPGQLDDVLDDTSDNIIRQSFAYDLSALYLLPAQTVRQRPDVRQAEMNLIAQNAQIGKAVAELMPNVDFSGFFGFQADKLPKLPNHKSRMFTLSPGLKLPLIHWGALMNQVELEKEATKELAAAYQGTLLNAVSEIRTAMVTVSEQYAKNQSTAAALGKMKDISALTLAQYDSGLIELSETLATFQKLLQAQTDMASGNGALFQSVVTFYKSVGN